jgi:hypothetical protein
VGEILTTAIDDPDLGKLDQNLPKEISSRVDPNNDRPFMGGIEGPTSQGFRHMYFGGWKGKHPVITFQIPPRAIGQAPYRFETLALYAKNAIRSGNLVWGTRTLGWAMHYIQDLTQPFHSVQAISKKMVPWSELLTWPPKKGFENLVKESTRIITNYHWAYEGYVRDIAKKGQDSPFYDCLVHPEKYSELKLDLKAQTPIQLAFDIAKTSIPLAPDLGSSEIDFFGKLLLQPGVDFTKNVDMINNIEYASRPDLQGPRGRLHDVTCRALANTALGSRLLIQWAFQN